MENPDEENAAQTTPDDVLPEDASPTVRQRLSDAQATTLEDLGHVSRYRLGSVLGQGGMGEVRSCRDRRVGRDVAMKVIRPEQRERDEIRARFLREARVQGQLEHPSIVPVYDLGLGDEGATYFTMKRVRGVGLDSVLRGLRRGDLETVARFTRHKLLAAFTSVCNAVHYAHHRGVIHRDLKPANIMLGDFGEVYALDWGVARLIDASSESDAPLPRPVQVELEPGKHTAHGTVIGTLGYIAPEGLLGGASVASDVYALGAILFEVLMLESLHRPGTVPELIGSTLAGPAATVAERAPERDVPLELEAIWLRATRKDPSERYRDVGELCEAVERFLEGDRDLTRRQALAHEHASRADALASQALSTHSEEDRRQAIHEAGRALALDPSQVDALGTLVRLLLAPPRALPLEVRARVEADEASRMATAASAGVVNYLAWALFVLLCISQGVRDLLRASVCATLFVTSAMVCWHASRTQSFPRWKVPFLAGLSTVAILFLTSFFGPLIVVPAALVANTAAYTLAAQLRTNVALLGLSALAFVALMAAPYLGLLQPSYVFDPGVIHVTPRTVDFTRHWTPVLLAATHAILLILAGRVFGRVGAALRASTERIHLLAWHLEQIVPDRARVGSPSLPARKN